MIFVVKIYVLHTKGAAANSVSLIFVLLIASSQGQLVNEVQGDCSLSGLHFFGLEVWKVET